MSSDRLVAIGLLLVFALYASQISGIELDVWASDSFLTARTLPIMLAIAGVFLACVLLLWPESSQRVPGFSRAQWRRLGLLMLALAGFAASVDVLGLWFACALFLPAAQLIEGERRPLALVGLGLGCPFALWLVVEKGLQQQISIGTAF